MAARLQPKLVSGDSRRILGHYLGLGLRLGARWSGQLDVDAGHRLKRVDLRHELSSRAIFVFHASGSEQIAAAIGYRGSEVTAICNPSMKRQAVHEGCSVASCEQWMIRTLLGDG